MRHLVAIAILLCATAAVAAAEERVHLRLDTSEADAVLAIMDKRSAGKAVTHDDWQKPFTSEPYVRLKKREASMHRDFTDEEFKRFVLSDTLAKKLPLLQRTLDTWKKADLGATARRRFCAARLKPRPFKTEF